MVITCGVFGLFRLFLLQLLCFHWMKRLGGLSSVVCLFSTFCAAQSGAGKRAQFVRLCAVAQAERTKKIWKSCFVRASLDHPAHKKMEGIFLFSSRENYIM